MGGMAGIFEATGPKGRPVAIKLMRLDVDHQEVIRDRFNLEVEIAERVQHDHLIKTFDRGLSANNEPFLVMELLDGQTVEEFWKENDRKLPFITALRIVRDILKPLGACHREGIVHRDIKPSNLYLAGGKAILFDFGVAKVRWAKDSVAVRGAILGTPAYMAPEQAMGVKDLDPRTDIFAVGATLFSLISGDRVNDGETADESFIIAATTPARSLAAVAPDVPVDVIQLTNKALAWERRDRFDTADEMGAAIDALLAREAQLVREQKERSRHSDFLVQSSLGESLEDVELDPIAVLLISFFQHLERLFRSVRAYGWGHSHTVRSHSMLFEHLGRVFQEAREEGHHELTLRVTPNCIESLRVPIWEPQPPFDDIPYNLFSSGFRTIRFLPEVSEGEILELLKLLLLDPTEDMEAEDDLATLLTERNLENVVVELVSPLENIALLEGYDTFEATLQAIQQEADQTIEELDTGDHRGVLNERSLRAEAEGMSVSVTRDLDLSSHERVRLLIQGQLREGEEPEFSDPEWWTRLPWILGRALSDADTAGDPELVLTPMFELVGRWIDLGRFEALALLYRDLSGAAEPKQRTTLAVRVFGSERLQLLIEGLGRVESFEVAETTAAVRQLLEDLIDRGLPAVLDSLPTVSSPKLLAVLLDYLHRYYAQSEPRVHSLLRTESPGLVLALLDLVTRQSRERAISALRHATRYPDRPVWVSALGRRVDLGDDKVEDDIAHRLESDEEDDRTELLALIADRSVKAIEAYVTTRIDDNSFHSLSEHERSCLFNALHSINPAAAEELAIGLAKGQRIITNANRERTRGIAIQFLGGVGQSEACVTALERASRSRWGASKNVRKLAADALEMVASRRED